MHIQKWLDKIGLSLEQIYSRFKWETFNFIIKLLIIAKVSQWLFPTKTNTTKLLRLHKIKN